MSKIEIKIDGHKVKAAEGATILEAALNADIYIPHLCAHHSVSALEKLVLKDKVYQGEKEFTGDFQGKTISDAAGKGCGLCKVKINNGKEIVPACRVKVKPGMAVVSKGDDLQNLRHMALKKIFLNHPHACLLCEQREGCSRSQCSMNVAENERCCVLLGRCELGKVADYIGYPLDLPPYKIPGEKTVIEDPLFIRDYSLCIGCLRCVRACQDIARADILGAVLKGDRYFVGTVKPGRMEDVECRFCGACVEICPTGAIRDREGIETPAGDSPLPCANACPGGIDIPAYVRKIAENDLAEARQIISRSVPLPATLGYVCFHPCEDHCRRAHLDKPVAICDLKRFAFEDSDSREFYKPDDNTGKRVAIIGAGPAGLAAAWLLGIKGHKVTLFDAEEKPGGYLRQAIPGFRLPLKALEKDLSFLDSLGIEFQGKRKMGVNLDPHQLREWGYDAVLLAMGTPLSRKINVEGSDLENVLWGIDFLRAARSANSPVLDGPVIVVGGGSVAVDTAMTALRNGAESVELVSLESEAELPAVKEEVEQAKEEKIIFTHGWGPVKFHSTDGKLSAVEFKECTRVYDDSGYFAPEYREFSRITREAKWVILAIGQTTDSAAFGDEADKVLNSSGLMPHQSEIEEKWLPGFFGAGDLVYGPTSVIEAIASGKRSAASIDRFLGGSGDFETAPEIAEKFDARNVSLEGRNIPENEKVSDRIRDNRVIKSALSSLEAVAEANRCLRCNIRRLVEKPVLPPEEWILLIEENIHSIPETEGVCELADMQGNIIKIKGSDNLNELLNTWLADSNVNETRKFRWIEDRMYTQKESELLQQFIQQHGEMPDLDDELDDLF